MTVTGHIPTGMDAIQGVNAGMDQINHIQYIADLLAPKDSKSPPVNLDSPEAVRVFQFLKEQGTVIDPTMALFELIRHPASKPFSAFEPGIDKVAPELAGPLNSGGVPPAFSARAEAMTG